MFDLKESANEALELLHGYAIELNSLQDDLLELSEAYDVVPYSSNVAIHDEIDILYQSINPIAENLKSYFLSSRHGGARSNAGRKKEEPTRQIRVPESLYNLVNELKITYKDLIDADKETFQSSLQSVIDERHTGALNKGNKK